MTTSVAKVVESGAFGDLEDRVERAKRVCALRTGAVPDTGGEPPLIAIHRAWAEERPGTRPIAHDGRIFHMDVEPVITDRHIAGAELFENLGRLRIAFATTPEGEARLRRASREQLGGHMAVLYDGGVVDVPVVLTEVGGTGEIPLPDGVEGSRERVERKVRDRWPAGSSRGVDYGTDGALRVAAEAIEALERGEWRRVAELVDPGELAEWYADLLSRPSTSPPSEVTAEQLKRWDPDMPDAVAAHQVERLRKDRAEAGSWVARELAGVEDEAELARLDPVEAFARYLQARDPSWQLEKRLEAMDPEIAAYVSPVGFRPRREVIGAVPEGDETAHVVYRVVAAGEDTADIGGDLAVVTLHVTPSGWRLVLQGELFHHGGVTVVVDPDAPGPGGGG